MTARSRAHACSSRAGTARRRRASARSSARRAARPWTRARRSTWSPSRRPPRSPTWSSRSARPRGGARCGSTRSGSTPARRCVPADELAAAGGALGDAGGAGSRSCSSTAPCAPARRAGGDRGQPGAERVPRHGGRPRRRARRLALAAEYRDDNTPEHTQRVGALAARMARQIAQHDRLVRLVRRAAPLHDLGKIAIPDSILLKPGQLADGGVRGRQDARGARRARPRGRRLRGARGRGADRPLAPRALGRQRLSRRPAGEAIPLDARLVHVADVFDVLVHERPYKEAWTVEDAAGEIRAARARSSTRRRRGLRRAGSRSWTAG